MSSGNALPEGYARLEQFVELWALPDLADRAGRRADSTAEERRALYDAVKDIAPAALAELDRKPRAALDEPEQRLLQLLLGYAHVAMAIEIRGDGEAAHALQSQHMVIAR